MCGICGWVGEGRVEESTLRTMAGALAHRGPDAAGFHFGAPGEGVGLGHRRLSIIDLEGGDQPIANEDETLWLVLNGEIYNHRELRAGLLERGHRFRTRSDSEVVLHLYEEHGVDCLRLLRGMFAFALWDSVRKRLFAARDPLGQKPLFYAERDGELLFASEAKALLAAEPALRELDPEALDQYLALRIVPDPRSMFRGVKKLPPAHLLCFEPGSTAKVERYWEVDFEPKLEGSDEELIEALEERIVESLRLHMESDVPVGAFLSGGLDSTLVVAMLSRHVAPESLQTFAGSLPYGEYDEAPYARLVAERYGTVHVEDEIRPSLLEGLMRVVYHLDEPADPLAVCMDRIAAIASRSVKVVLGGDGGDELFGGYDRYRGLALIDPYAKLPAALRRAVLGPLIERLPQGSWYRSRGHQLRWMHRLSFHEGGARYAAALGYAYFDREARSGLYGPAMGDLARHGDPEAPIRLAFENAPARETLDRMVYADWQTRLPGHAISILDRMTMAHGLEARSPFLDPEMVRFAARLPTRVKIRGRSLRWIQKRLGERYLPEALMKRPKQGFSSALPYMLRDEYRRLGRVFLADARLAEVGLLDQRSLDRVRAEHDSGAADHASRLWLLLNAELWFRIFIEGEAPEALQERLEH